MPPASEAAKMNAIETVSTIRNAPLAQLVGDYHPFLKQ